MASAQSEDFWEHWYEVVDDDSLRQGDVFRGLVVVALPQDLPFVETPPEPDQDLPVSAKWFEGDWIVMSASCDVTRDSSRYPWVLLGRVLPTTPENLDVPEGKRFDERVEVLKKEFDRTRFLLAECPLLDPPFAQSFVAFRPHLTIPRDYLGKACSGSRLRLRPPFRELFGNWVGSNISRVGIETYAQIPAKKITMSASKLLGAASAAETLLKLGSNPKRKARWWRRLLPW